MKEPSSIEVHDIYKQKVVSVLNGHKDMIDSLLKLNFSAEKINSKCPYMIYLISASRDRSIMLWKLVDGRIMRKNIKPVQNLH